MAKNGEMNETFGLYRTLCCGTEMVIPEGEPFPDCPKHIHLTTEWKPVVTNRIPKASEATPKKKRGAA